MSGPPAARAELEAIFREALAEVDAAGALGRRLERRGRQLVVDGRPLPARRIFALAVGKAAAPMAALFERRASELLTEGLAVTVRGHGGPLAHFALREAAHPVPDAGSERAGLEALALLGRAGPEDLVCVLLSGGSSSLLACPVPGLALPDVAAATRLLLRAGADIAETNAVRKHLVRAAGGRLARHCRAGRIEVLAVSDVPGDRLDLIGSGPFAADPSTYAEAREILSARGLWERLPPAVRDHLEAGARGEREETAKPGDPALARVHSTLLATNRDAVAAAREAARRRGWAVRVVSPPLAGEARREARRLVSLGAAARGDGPLLLVAGGETAVTVRGDGRGGRNQELALAAALALEGAPPAALLAAGTDGVDGPTPAAGAHADPGTVGRGRRAGVDAREALARNDSHGFFRAEGGLFTTGPTGTNVMDLALLRMAGRAEYGRVGRVESV